MTLNIVSWHFGKCFSCCLLD